MAGTWVAQRQHEEAFEAFDLAEGRLGPEPTGPDAGWWREWLQIQLDRMWLHYTRQEIGQLRALVEKVKPALEQYGSPAQRSKFYVGLVLAGLMLDRFTVSEETLGYSRASLSAARESGNPSIIAFAQSALGFSHLWRGELDGAEEHLGAGLKLAEQTGDVAVQARSLIYLIVAYRKRGQVERVRD